MEIGESKENDDPEADPFADDDVSSVKALSDGTPQSKKRRNGGVTEQLLETLAQTDKLLQEPVVETEEDCFGKSIAAALKTYGKQEKRLAMLRIQQVLYDIESSQVAASQQYGGFEPINY